MISRFKKGLIISTLSFLTAFALIPLGTLAQGTITGGTTVALPGTYFYSVTDDVVYPSPSWQVSGDASVVSSSVSGLTYSCSIRFNSPGPYTVSFMNAGSTLTTLAVTANCKPVTTPVATFGYVNYCGSTTITATGTPPSGQTWYWQTSSTGTSELYSSLTPFTVTTSGTYYLRANKTTATGCWSVEQATAFVAVVSQPFVSAPSKQICSGQNTALTITNTNGVPGTTYTWTASASNVSGAFNSSGNPISQTLTVTDGTNSGTVTYTITPSANGCVGPSTTATVTVYPVPQLTNLPASLSLCSSGAQLNFTALTNTANTTIFWDRTPSGPVNIGASTGSWGPVTDNLQNVGTTVATMTYTFRPIYSGCLGPSKDYTVTLNPIIGAPSSTTTTQCNGDGTAYLTATPGANANSVKWYDLPTGGTLKATGLNSPTVSATTTYYISSYNDSTVPACEGANPRVAVTLTLALPPSATSTQFCGSGPFTITANAPNNKVRWYDAPTLGNLVGNGLVSPSVTSTTTFYICSFDGPCETTPRQAVTLTVGAVPAYPTFASTSLCKKGSIVAIPGANGNTVNWYDFAGGTLLLANSATSPLVTFTNTSFYVTTFNTATLCESVGSSVTVIINPEPSFPIVSSAAFCGSGTFTIPAAVGANGTEVRWYNASTSGTFVNGNTSPATTSTTTYYVTSYNASTTCETVSRLPVTITVEPTPTISTSGSTVFTYGNPNSVTLSAPSAYAYRWIKDGIDVGTAQSYPTSTLGTYQVGTKTSASALECLSQPLPVTSTLALQATPINLVSVTSIMKAGVTSSTSLYTLAQQDLAQSIAYQDGIGRTFQSVGVGMSGTQTDIVSVSGFGLNGLADTVSFLPYATAAKDGRFKPNALRTNGNQYVGSEQQQFYQTAAKVAQDAQPYARVVRKASPDARALEQGAPGADWQPGAQHMVKSMIALNNATTYKPRYWKTDGTTNSYYPAGQVGVGITTDENGSQVRSYTNALGQTILKQVQEGTTNWLETYYVYDQFGRLKYQVPPKAVTTIGASTTWSLAATASTNELVYKYFYDSLGRIKEKKVPGAAMEYVVYDPLGRPVLTKDGSLAANQWRFVKYDQYGRVAYTGLYTITSTRKALQDQFNLLDYTTQPYYETLAAGGVMKGYTNTVFPTTGLTILTANYYDTYDFDQNGTADFTYNATHLATGLPATASTTLRDMPTGSGKLVIGTTTWLRSAVFYDNYDRPVQTQSYNHLNTTTPDISSVVYADLVHVANTKMTHNGPTVVTVEQRYVYDPNWRTTEIWHKTNGGTEYKVAAYTYNALGQVVDKQLHTVAGVPLQSIDYRYHIRGWLKSINNAQLTIDPLTNDEGNDYFGMELNYNTAEASGLGNTLYFNGNVSAVKWKGPAASAGSVDQRSYKYNYDKSERLTGTTFAANTGSAWTKEANTLNETFAYDVNGNVSTLLRKQNQRGLSGTTVTSSALTVDQLTYTYTANTNRMAKVTDAIGTTIGVGDFKDGSNVAAEYTYTGNGSMNKDLNKGIQTITYNVLGKPQVVTYSGTPTKTVTYTYDAAGNKLKMVTLANSVTTTTDYIGGFVYTNNALSFFSSPEGRIVKNGANYEYQYAIADHQGNTRVVFSSVAPTPTNLTATFEGDANDNSNLYSNVNATFVVPYGSANNTAGGVKVVRMNQTYSAGPAKSLKVYPGDKVDMETYAYYESASGYGSTNSTVAAMVTSIASAFGGVSGGTGESGSIFSGVNSALTNVGLGPNQGDGVPSAYLNYILFDQQYKVVDMGWTAVPATANFAKQKISIPQITVKEAGYMFVYLSYETASNNWVYFDDFKVVQTKTNVIQYNEFYSHGLQTANSWTRENATGNNYLGNGGTELNTTTSLYDLDYRNFDPILGRMAQVDPMADKYAGLTPYNYSFNRPNMVVDVNGADPEPNYWYEESMQRRAARDRAGFSDNGGNPLIGGGSSLDYLRNVGGWNGGSSLSGGHITRGSGGHWADGMDMNSDLYSMSRNVFEAVHNVNLSDPETRWSIAMGASTRATGTIEYSRNASERYRLTLDGGRVTNADRLYSRQQMNMIASANKLFGLLQEGHDHGPIDLVKAVAWLNANAAQPPPYGNGKCATWVINALKAGGAVYDVYADKGYAKNFGPTLLDMGLKALDVSSLADYSPIAGDVAIIQPWAAKNQVIGHMGMYTGTQWASDYFQGQSFYPWAGSRGANDLPSFVIYRYTKP